VDGWAVKGRAGEREGCISGVSVAASEHALCCGIPIISALGGVGVRGTVPLRYLR
jgi:hypothetical protein